MNRRGALVTIGLTAFGGIAWAISKPLHSPQSNPASPVLSPSDPPAKRTLDDRLRDDIARLKPRVYSEEGIPVFLACEDLVPAKTSKVQGKVTLTAMNLALASALHRDAEAWQRIRPNAEAKDLAPIIEVLADLDFAKGGTEEER